MSKPEMRTAGGVYALEWPEELITARLDRFVQNSKFEVSCELLLQSMGPGPSHIHGPARFNLSSTTAHKTLARFLEDRIPDTDWYAIIESMCVPVLHHYREGEPAVRLATLPASERTAYRLAPILFDGKPNLLFGFGGSMKSTLADFFGLLIATGLTSRNLRPIKGPIYYLDYETDAQEHRHRLDMLAHGLGIKCPDNFLYRYCTQPLSSDITDIQRVVTTEEIAFLIVDSALGACGASLNDDDAAGRVFLALRSLRIGSLVIAHRRKNNPDGAGPLGSVYWTNSPRAVYEVRAAEQVVKGVQEIGLFPTKVNWGDRIDKQGFSFEFTSDSILVQGVNVPDVPDFEAAMKHHERLAARIERVGPQAVAELAEWLSTNGKTISEATVRTTLHRYDKLFVHIAAGEHAGKWARRALETAV